MWSYKSTLFLATQQIQFTTHFSDFESKSKKLYGSSCRSNVLRKIKWKCAENER